MAFVVLASIGLTVAGLLAAMLIRDSGGARVKLGENELTVLTTPTPRAEQQRALVALPSATPVETPAPPAPTFAQDTQVTVVDWSGFLDDGQFMAWPLSRGAYLMRLEATGDGATAEWSGTRNCNWKSKAMLRFSQACYVETDGHIIVSNPTTFGLGKAISATLKVVRVQ